MLFQKVQQIYIRLIKMYFFFSVIFLLTNHEALYNLNFGPELHPPFKPITALFYNNRSVTTTSLFDIKFIIVSTKTVHKNCTVKRPQVKTSQISKKSSPALPMCLYFLMLNVFNFTVMSGQSPVFLG